ncbi:MAG: PadR family transcriptional regulator [Chloroflexota bacterium]
MAKKSTKESLYENFSQEIRRGVLVLAVLSQLSEPQYGYSLKQRLHEKGLEINEGTLYPLLRRLESQGLLQSSWEVVNDTRPRRYYQISDQGQTIHSHLIQDWENMIDVMSELLAKEPHQKDL